MKNGFNYRILLKEPDDERKMGAAAMPVTYLSKIDNYCNAWIDIYKKIEYMILLSDGPQKAHVEL